MSHEREPIQNVNIEFGDDVSKMLYEASKQTYSNRPGMLLEYHKSFFGFRALSGAYFKDFDNLLFNMGFDGVGTKIEISERLEDHSVVAHDLFAMVCDDAVVRGAEPIAVGSILDVRHLGQHDDEQSKEYAKNAVRQLCKGYVKAAKAAGVVVVNGEVAELGDRVDGYGEFNYNWGAGVLWFAHEDRILTGREIRKNDSLVGLVEKGFRSNGITDVRKTMLEHYKSEWHNKVISDLGELSLGQLVQQPSTIYSKFVTKLTGGFDKHKEPRAKVTGVAHITGGGQPGKLMRMLEPSGLGAIIDNPIEPPPIMKHVQELGRLTDEQAYGKWHMGPGMVIATPEPDQVLIAARKHGAKAQVIGHVSQQRDIIIQNRGSIGDKEWLVFPRKS